MSYCCKCGNEVADGSVACPSCGVRVNSVSSVREDNGGFGWGLLGFLIPLAGFILYLSWKDSRPNTASVAGKWALIGVAVNVVYMLLVN